MIFSRHSVLKRGCSTWDKEQMPQAEFESRLEAVRREITRRGLDALVVYGDNYAFGDLCYLTNYFPKVRGGIAVVPQQGPISLLLNIGSRDVPFAKSLTWVEDVRASNQVGRDGAALLKERGFAQAKVGLVDSGQGFPLPQLEEMKSALPEIQWRASHGAFLPMRLKKSARELAALRAAGSVLGKICEGARAFVKPGRKEYEVVADIDRLARDKGVEDIRIMAGEKRLRAPSFKSSAKLGESWAVYLAIQHERYWVEAGQTHILAADSKLLGAYQKAQELVAQMAARLKPGTAVAGISECARTQLGEFYATTAHYGLGNGIGLNQWEAPFLSDDEARQIGSTSPNVASFEESMTLALRVVLENDGKLALCGDSFEVTAHGAVSLIGG
ncbi:MAG: M24 family metallopeptidase [Alphaproteobacteria bacterium]